MPCPHQVCSLAGAFSYGGHETWCRIPSLHLSGKEGQDSGWALSGVCDLNGHAAVGKGLGLVSGRGSPGTIGPFTQPLEKSQKRLPEGGVNKTGPDRKVIRRHG